VQVTLHLLSTQVDFNLDSEDINESVDTLRIINNMSAAMSGRTLPFQYPPSAGMVPCSLCMGGRTMQRFTPNIAKVFGLADDMWTEV
jgi:hypothetical protein